MRTLKYFATALLGFVFLLGGGLLVFAYDDGDWQFWNTDGIEYQISKMVKLSADVEIYFGDDMTDFYYWHVQPSAAVQLIAWLETGMNYRYLEEKKNGEWLAENRPSAFGTLIQKIAGFDISDRNQLEYRSREQQDDTWRYRNKLRVVAPLKFTKFQIRPYVDEEIYVDLVNKEYNQNQAAAGFTSKPMSNLKMDIYYLKKMDWKSGDWLETNILEHFS